MTLLICPECKSIMALRQGRHGPYYACIRWPKCKATHGAHARGGGPLGLPGDRETREARKKAHQLFDRLWKGPEAPYTREQAYGILGSLMGLKKKDAHIGKMTRNQCLELVGKLRDKFPQWCGEGESGSDR